MIDRCLSTLRVPPSHCRFLSSTDSVLFFLPIFLLPQASRHQSCYFDDISRDRPPCTCTIPMVSVIQLCFVSGPLSSRHMGYPCWTLFHAAGMHQHRHDPWYVSLLPTRSNEVFTIIAINYHGHTIHSQFHGQIRVSETFTISMLCPPVSVKMPSY